MPKTVDVQTGEVVSRQGDVYMTSSGIGSCIVVAIIDPRLKIGGLAHIMLPGRAPPKGSQHILRYAYNAIDELAAQMTELGAELPRASAVMAGAANVLKDPDDSICGANIESVTAILSNKSINVVNAALGGTARRRVEMNPSIGVVSCCEGSNKEFILMNVSGARSA